ncbi:hypothetical protein HNQ81_002182 [Desulfoprunum benzoelyticum]|uniref:Uncharacterized protein n=1 Tax=Desulfoprunum benzoelyticum TaxID=1506996 RepID=A0A840UUD2_9BACT|nr:hypothetical protein [Desulfoprunum benzoelyticum]
MARLAINGKLLWSQQKTFICHYPSLQKIQNSISPSPGEVKESIHELWVSHSKDASTVSPMFYLARSTRCRQRALPESIRKARPKWVLPVRGCPGAGMVVGWPCSRRQRIYSRGLKGETASHEAAIAGTGNTSDGSFKLLRARCFRPCPQQDVDAMDIAVPRGTKSAGWALSSGLDSGTGKT